MSGLKGGLRLARMAYSGGTRKDGPDGAGHTATRPYPRCIRRFHMDTPSPEFRARALHPEDAQPFADRFHAMYMAGLPEACWLWRGVPNKNGYGQIIHAGRKFLAHRVAWVLDAGRDLAVDLTIDHLCWNKLCVNPRHLEPVPNRVNARRGKALKSSLGDLSKPRRNLRHSDRPSYRTAPCPLCGLVLNKSSLRYHLEHVPHTEVRA